MRGLGAFQMAQMKHRGARIFQLCQHLRSAIDIYEQIASEPFQKAEAPPTAPPPAPAPAAAPQRALGAEKLTYSLKEAAAAIGVSRTTLHKAIAAGQIKAVKLGRRTLITADTLRQWITDLPSK